MIVTAGIYVFPTLSNLNPETTKFPFKQKINFGLDLQGGLYLVLGVDFNKVYKDVVDRQASSLKIIEGQRNLRLSPRVKNVKEADEQRMTSKVDDRFE